MFELLREWPVWVPVMLLCLVTMLPIQVMRNRFEGMPYQVAWSALFGDVGLAFILMIAIGVLQRTAVYGWLGSKTLHGWVAILAVAIGVVWLSLDWRTQYADRYHHIVVAPTLTYLMLTLLPVIFTRGTKVEAITTVGLLVLWGVLVVVDIGQDRMNQRGWLHKRGFFFKN